MFCVSIDYDVCSNQPSVVLSLLALKVHTMEELSLKIAAVNFEAAFADINENLSRVAEFVLQAAGQGVELILRAYSEGADMVVRDLQCEPGTRPPARIDPTRYWMEELPDSYVYAWEHHNKAGEAYNRSVAKPNYASAARSQVKV